MARRTQTKTKAPRKPRKGEFSRATLAGLGAERLAELVLEAAERDPAFKRIAKAALASAEGPEAVAAIVDRRLTALERARGFIEWNKVRSFAADLTSTVNIIEGQLAPLDPGAAAERLVRFLMKAEAVFERVDDSGGYVQDVYLSDALDALTAIAPKLPAADAKSLANRLLSELEDESYGLIERTLLVLVPRLDQAGLADLDAVLAREGEPGAAEATNDVQDWSARFRHDRRLGLRQAIAEARDDVDAFVALEEAKDPRQRDHLGLARRLLEAGRAEAALDWVRRPSSRPTIAHLRLQDLADGIGPTDPARPSAALLEAAILDALDRGGEAQEVRWTAFAEALDAEALREHVARLDDFEEFAVMDRAHALVADHPNRMGALVFLLDWPDLARAGRHVVAQAEHWDGGQYYLLAPAAQALEDADPLAASVLYRTLLADILARARSKAYGHGARHLACLDRLAPLVEDWSALPEHHVWRAGIEKDHSRKSDFWARVNG